MVEYDKRSDEKHGSTNEETWQTIDNENKDQPTREYSERLAGKHGLANEEQSDETEQKARREAIAKAKETKRTAQVKAAQSSSNVMPTNPENNVFTVSSDLAPTFREIMSASKIEKKESADGDTWIRIVKP